MVATELLDLKVVELGEQGQAARRRLLDELRQTRVGRQRGRRAVVSHVPPQHDERVARELENVAVV